MSLMIERLDLNEQVYQILKDQILTRQFKGGERLDLNDLSEKMGVSKTPVKLAIHRLANDGLVEVVPRSGTYVIKLTSDLIGNVMDARIMIEKWCIERLSKEDSNQLVIQLEEIVSKAQRNLDSCNFSYQDFLKLDILFHKSFVSMNNNPVISNQYESLISFLSMAITRIFHFQNFDRSKEGLLEHNQIIEAIKSYNLLQAKKLLVKHLEQSKQHTISLIEQNGGTI